MPVLRAHVRAVVSSLLFVFLTTFLSASPVRRAAEPVAGKYIVALPQSTGDVDALAGKLAKQYGGKVLAVWRHALKGFYAELSAENAERLARDKRVSAVEEDSILHPSAAGSQITGAPPRQTVVPPLPGVSGDPLWHLTRISHRDHETAHPRTTQQQIDDYYTYFYSNDGVAADGRRATIYIIDTGVVAAHREFQRPAGSPPAVAAGSNRAGNPDYDNGIEPDFVPRDTSPATSPCNGNVHDGSLAAHGTAVASMAVGQYVGVAKGATLVPVGLLSCTDPNSTFSSAALMLSALDWVADDSDNPDPNGPPGSRKLAVLSMSSFRATQSQGSIDCNDPTAYCDGIDDTTVLEETVTRIVDSGVPVVVSANNQGADACRGTPARLSRRGGRKVFGRPTRVITVGGSDRDDRRWERPVGAELGSNFGQCVDIWAPAAELRVASTNRDANNNYTLYKAADQSFGTSYSAPIVAGVIARMLAEDPSLRSDDFTTADEVWKRLERNATRLPASSMGAGSPSLLVYLGAANFEQHPQSVNTTSGATATLTVAMKETAGLTYQWYRGAAGDTRAPIAGATASSYAFTVCAPGGTCNQEIDPANGQDFWVRVKRSGVPGFADSNAARVRINQACTGKPEVVQHPQSVWIPEQVANGSVTLQAKVKSAVPFCYQWQEIGAATQPPIVTGQPATSETTLTFNVPASTQILRHYRLVLWGPGFCGTAETASACVTASDTAQVRLCTPPNAGTFQIVSRDFDSTSDSQGLRDSIRGPNTGEDLRHRWLYAPLNGTPAEPLRIELPDGTWRTYRGAEILPPLAGEYKVESVNSCGEVVSTNQVKVKTVRDYDLVIRVEGQIPYNNKQLPGAPRFTGACARRQKIFVEVRNTTANGIPRRPTFTWSLESGDERQQTNLPNDTLLTAPLLGNRDVTVRVVDPITGADYDLLIKLGTNAVCSTECTTSSEDFQLLAGQCTLNGEPVYTHHQGGVIDIDPYLYDLKNHTKLNNADFQFTWMVVNANGTKTVIGNTPTLQRVVGASVENLEVIARKGDQCDRMPVQIRPKTTSCAACKYACRRRAVPHVNGVPTETMTVASGQQLVLTLPTVDAGSTYEWHRDTAATADEVFSTAASVTVNPTDTTTYYAITINPANEAETSESAYISVEGSGDHTAVAEPGIQVVTPGATVTFTAYIPNVVRVPSTRYEWRRGSDYNVSAPVVGTDAVLTLYNPPDDASYWCRIIKDGVHYDTNVATVIVNCSTVTGTIFTTPADRKVARTDMPTLEAHGTGKLLMYRWERWLPGDTSGTFAGIGPAIRPTVTAPVTHFKVTAEDACGTIATFGPVPIYLCIPTITAHPQGRTVTPGTPVTMTVAATPAIDGQPLDFEWYRAGDTNRTTRLHTGTSYTTTLPAGATSDSFYVAVKSTCDTAPHYTNSNPALINVCAYPAVTANSVGSITQPGQQAVLSVSVSGRGTMTYQWYRGLKGDTSNPLDGETSNYLVVSPSTTTNYWCLVTADATCPTQGPTMTVPVCSAPGIATQPANKIIFSNTSTTLSVAASAGTNTEPLKYQWYQQSGTNPWTLITGATSASYTTPALTSTTSYRVEVSAGACKTTSSTAVVSMCTYPEVVNASPAETKTTAGQSVTLSLPVISPVYDKIVRWFEGESGVTTSPAGGGYLNATLTVAPAATKKYWAQFEHNGCVSRTTTYTINVCVPAITSQPSGSSVASGTAVTLTVGTSALAGQTFQWYTGTPGTTTSPVAGATSASLTVTPASTTTYWVRVTGTCGQSVDSAAATVTVCVPPTISSFTGPAVNIRAGQSTVLAVGASGTDLSYQWYIGNLGVTTNPVANSNWNNLTVTPPATTSYWVKVTSMNLCSTNTSRVVTVNVCQPPVFSVQPQSQKSFAGKNVTLTASASSSTGAVTYQWYIGASGTTTTPIAGATSASLTVAPTAQTSYWVRATNSVCTTDSAAATISMCTYAEVVNASPADQSLGYGESVTLALPVMSPVRDKMVTWYRGVSGDRTNVVGSAALNRTYTTPALTATTSYWAEFDEGGCISRTTTYTVRVCIPAITAQPAGGTIQSGQSRTLTVGTTAISGQTYQWYIGTPGTTTTPVSGATSASVTVSPAATTSYWVRVTGTCGQFVDSAAATVTVCNPPSITSVTPTTYIQSGQQAAINVTAGGSNLSYQWYAGAAGVTTNPVSGGNAATILVAPTATTSYWARVTSEGLCTANSPAVTVDVCTTPSITTQPASVTIRTGSSTTLSVATSASGATYQWYIGASGTTTTPVSGATSATLTVTPANDTQYWVRVTRGACRADSAAATVTVCRITASIPDHNTSSGQTVTLTATVTNHRASVYYTWYRGNSGDTSVVLGAGTGAYQLNVSPTATTKYWVRVNDGTCSYDSAAATVNVCIPTITAQPQSVVINNGQSATLSVTATGAPLTYQWYIGDSGVTTSPIAGATGAAYTTPALSAATKYWVRVNGCSAVNSATATVTVCIPPSINGALTTSTSKAVGNPAYITVNASGTNPTYQWYMGASGDTSRPIGGANAATYNFTLSQSEYYWVRVTACGTSVNSPAVLYSVAPTITTQPQSVAVPRNTTATLTVAATGTYLTYQWYQGSPGVMTTPMNGATSATFVTPAVTGSATYWCKVTSGSDGLAYSNGATVSLCNGPSASFTAQYLWANSWQLSVNVVQSDLGNVKYQWYIGTPGNVAQSTPYGSTGSTYYRTIYSVTEPQTWWVRIWYTDDSCYSDTGGQTIYPVE
jgi:Ig-like domain CHU_C associated/Peptidase inhibitor I9